MLRQKPNVNCRTLEKESKIRKRGCSSSSSSSLIRHYQLKRAVSVRKKGGSSTPLPTWKMGSLGKSPPLVRQKASPKKDEVWENGSEKGKQHVAERKQRSKAANYQRRTSAVSQSENLVSYSCPNTDISKIPSQIQIAIPSVDTCLINVRNGLAVAKEMLKVLSRLWIHEDQRSSTVSLLSALQFELGQTRLQVDHLIREKAAWKMKEQEQDRIQNAVISTIGQELKVEKKLRKQAERLNKKLGNELADTKSSLLKALDDLHSEKRAREILEQVCDELAREIGEDKDEMEEMKRESAKVREEVEKEREMLQIADVLREERVQMKLMEAKYEFEEKNAAVERMKSEVEAYLKTQIRKEKSDNYSPSFGKIKELEEYLWKTLGASLQTGERGDNEEDDSASSDLHSIELNMDNNISKSYKWGYACDGFTPIDSKRSSVDGKIKGRRSVSEKTQRNIICLDRKRSSDANEVDLGIHSSDGIDRGRLLELISQNLKKGYQAEIENFEMVKDLRDHILSDTRISSSQDSHGSTRVTR